MDFWRRQGYNGFMTIYGVAFGFRDVKLVAILYVNDDHNKELV